MAFRYLVVASALLAPVIAIPPICPTGPFAPLSCHNTTAIQNTCCTEVQGQILQVQFWDTDPATGPADHWTIHGLWPDFCDGSYTEYCDYEPEYKSISCILEKYGRYDLLNFMKTYWKNYNGEDQELWEHEWAAHGTCYSTLRPSCYIDYTPQEEVVDFFQQVVDQFSLLPTYDFLAAAGIYPSTTKNYTNAQIMAALRAPRGVNATIECDDGGQLYEVEYTFNVQGSVADGFFVPQNPVGEGNGCPEIVRYLPKNLSSTPTVKNTETCSVS